MIQTVDHRHQTLDLGRKINGLTYYVRFTKELGYTDTNEYEELWTKSQESLRTLHGLISYIEKSDV